jgi:hypothetical protein
VTQSGSVLTFTNENGGTAQGRFLSATRVIADGWGGLIGNLVDGRIEWANGTIWARPASDISGQYTFSGMTTSVQQSGSNLTFTNEHGNTSSGRFLSATEVVATDWGGLTGTVGNGEIRWANGTVWTLSTPSTQENPDIGGTYSFGSGTTTVQQNGDALVFINEHGNSSTGRFLSPTQVVATQWGGLVGNIVGNRIEWVNGTVWTLVAPVIAGDYAVDGRTARVEQSGGDLTFINENGGSSRGRFLSASLVIANDWGGLTGTIVNGRIEWTNGSVWESTALDRLFAAFDDWDLAA